MNLSGLVMIAVILFVTIALLILYSDKWTKKIRKRYRRWNRKYGFKAISNMIVALGVGNIRQVVLEIAIVVCVLFFTTYMTTYNVYISCIAAVISMFFAPPLIYKFYFRKYNELVFTQLNALISDMIALTKNGNILLKILYEIQDNYKNPAKKVIDEMIEICETTGDDTKALEVFAKAFDYDIARQFCQLMNQYYLSGAKNIGNSLDNMQTDMDALEIDVNHDRQMRGYNFKKFIGVEGLYFFIFYMMQMMVGMDSYRQNITKLPILIFYLFMLVLNYLTIYGAINYYNADIREE